jgi:hypothetical protein
VDLEDLSGREEGCNTVRDPSSPESQGIHSQRV